MAAQFQIHQDSAEKENPMIAIKDKTTNFLKANLQQNSIRNGVGGGNIGVNLPVKKEKMGRTGLTVLTNNNNVDKAQTRTTIGGNKNFGNNAMKVGGNVAASQKTTTIPVEQFKLFSVYEDCNDDASNSNNLLQQRVAKNIDDNVAGISIDKENVYDTRFKSNKEFDIHDFEADVNLDTTAMSISEVLSPMSVDRSQYVNVTDIDIKDDEKSNESSQNLTKILPINDRQRFFEVVEYQQSILNYFRESEKKHRPKPHYMKRQSDINNSMRTILVDWLVEVSEEYNLDTETLFLSVSYIDRFLSQMSVVRSKLQLVGTAAMYIAAKYEEIYPPDVSEFVFITDDTYNKAQVLRMEQIILKILAFNLCTPTAYCFLNTYAVLHDVTDIVKYFSQYICELSLLEVDPYLRHHPSIISAASLALARYLSSQPIWSTELEEITTYKLIDMKELITALSTTLVNAQTLTQQAVQEKYKADKYHKVANIKPIELTPNDMDAIIETYEAGNTNINATTTEEIATKSNENVRKMISLMFN